jgi:hypothetical protein
MAWPSEIHNIYDMMTGVYLYTIPVRLADVLLIAVRSYP